MRPVGQVRDLIENLSDINLVPGKGREFCPQFGTELVSKDARQHEIHRSSQELVKVLGKPDVI